MYHALGTSALEQRRTDNMGGHVMSVPLYQAKAEFFKTLGHPARIRILELLSERDHAVHELLEKIAIEPSNLSQQLAVLRRTSLVVSHRQGGEVVYSVSVPEVRDLLLAARRILSGILAAHGALEAELTPDTRA
jgi:DNA-binding transcriptional ArsR family regulator